MIIPLRPDFAVVVDEGDAWLVDAHRYRPSGNGYAIRAGKKGEPRTCYLHRDIMQPSAGMQVDHINGIRHDCRRENLRLVTRQQNAWNTGVPKSKMGSRFKGVVLLKPSHYPNAKWGEGRRPYAARIRLNGKTVHLGVFDTEVEAALRYDEVASSEFGEHARLNFPQIPKLLELHEALRRAA